MATFAFLLFPDQFIADRSDVLFARIRRRIWTGVGHSKLEWYYQGPSRYDVHTERKGVEKCRKLADKEYTEIRGGGKKVAKPHADVINGWSPKENYKYQMQWLDAISTQRVTKRKFRAECGAAPFVSLRSAPLHPWNSIASWAWRPQRTNVLCNDNLTLLSLLPLLY